MSGNATSGNRLVASLKAATLIAHTLLKSQCKSDRVDEYRLIEERVRYSVMLGRHSRLDPVDLHRLTLAAWLSGLASHPEMRARLAHENNVESILDVSSEEIPARILSLVKTVQEVRDRFSLEGAALEEALEARDDVKKERALWRRLKAVLQDDQDLGATGKGAGCILVVDPDEVTAPEITSQLKGLGFETCVVRDADSAEAEISRTDLDAMMVRADLPVIDGIEFCRHIKSSPSTAGLPVIVLLGRRQKSAERRALMAGADEVFAPPFDGAVLGVKLKRLLAGVRGRQAHSVPAHETEQVRGPLQDMPLADTVQILAAGGKTSRITLCRDDQKGEVVLCEGSVVHAELGDVVGEEAFYEFLRWKEGTFFVAACKEEPLRKSIDKSLMSLLMEGVCRIDEERDHSSA